MKANMQNIMLDLETMGTGPNAAAVAIGACFFDIEARAIGTTFYQILDLDDVVRGGGEMDASTILWWLQQPEDARRAIYAEPNPCPPDLALTAFSQWIDDNASQPPLMWGNGANFDPVILASMYRRQRAQPPWEWRNDRCYRTIIAQHPGAHLINLERIGPKHHALHDAVHQARMLIEVLNPKIEAAEAGDSILDALREMNSRMLAALRDCCTDEGPEQEELNRARSLIAEADAVQPPEAGG